MTSCFRYLFSVGGDGNFFVFEMLPQEAIDEAVKLAKAKIPSARVRQPMPLLPS